jgi:hypothetical protein
MEVLQIIFVVCLLLSGDLEKRSHVWIGLIPYAWIIVLIKIIVIQILANYNALPQ